MEGCSKTRADAASGLPDDPLLEILSRVPAKSVCRFKCVSRAWRDLIADPDNRKKLRQPMQGLFVQKSEDSKVDNELLFDSSFSFIGLTAGSVPLDTDPCFSFLAEITGIETYFVGSCNGLILFGLRHRHRQEQFNIYILDGYIVCNPTTKQWSAVPACGSCEALTQTYLAFDPTVSSHFHLVQFQKTDEEEAIVSSLHVYSSETRTWSENQIDKQKEQGQLGGWHHQFILAADLDHHGAFVNGFLHFIVWRSDNHILVVDVQGKARTMINAPNMDDGKHGHNAICYLGQSQGHLHCVTLKPAYEKNGKLSTWVLQDYDTQEWVLKNTVNTFDVFGEKRGMSSDFQVVDIHQDCNVVFFLHEYKLTAYDMDRKKVTVIATFKDRKIHNYFARYVPYFSESPALTNKY